MTQQFSNPRVHPSLPGVERVLPGTSPGSKPAAATERSGALQDVRSSFDARPIGGTDFLVTRPFTFDNNYTFLGQVNFAVPMGYVAILRGFRFSSNAAMIVTLHTSGNGNPYATGMDLGQNQSALLPCYQLAGEGQTLGLMLTTTNVNGATGSVLMVGNLLPRRGVDLLAEPASERAPSAVDIAAAIYDRVRKLVGR